MPPSQRSEQCNKLIRAGPKPPRIDICAEWPGPRVITRYQTITLLKKIEHRIVGFGDSIKFSSGLSAAGGGLYIRHTRRKSKRLSLEHATKRSNQLI
jgi:hypothetical protein